MAAASFFDVAARALHLDMSFETSLNLLWVLTAAIVAILAGQFTSQFLHKHWAARQAAPRRPVGPPVPGAPKPLTIWHHLLLRLMPLMIPLLNSFFVALGVLVLRKLGYAPDLIIALKPLFTAWIFITAVYVLTESLGKTIFVAVLVLPLSLPFMLPYIREFEGMLADLSFSVGKTTVTALMVTKLLIIGTLMLWTAGAVKDGINGSLARMQHIRWSTRQLMQNLIGFGVYAMAVLIALSILGIDLTAFAVLGGALGVGIGLGLQKIASNFISGMILLSEQSIQVNDMIEIAGTNVSGLVRHTGARYTLIETLDNREIMIPNDDLITNRVINWTYTNSSGILKIEIGVSYDSDLEQVRDILLDIAGQHELVLKDPAPSCALVNFGASSVDFMLVVHLEDVRERRAGIKSELLFEIWRRFKAASIDIPYPQMTIHYTPPNPPVTADADKTA